LKQIASKIKKLSHKINKSTLAIQQLKNICSSKPPSYCPTRWSSLYLVLSWYLKNQKAVVLICEKFSWDHLSVTEWSNVHNIVDLLNPFANHTKLLEGQIDNTISAVIPSIMELINHLIKFENSNFFDNEIIKEMKDDMIKRFSNFNDPKSLRFDPIFVTSTLLDLKFALCLNDIQISNAIKFLESFGTEEEKNLLQQNHIERESAFSSVQNLIFSALAESNISRSSKISDEITFYIDYLKKQFLKDFNLQISYFGSISEKNNSNLTVFQFWTNRVIRNKFPMISKIACDIQVVPATQASSERTFSISGDCLNSKRTSLNSIKLQREVMFIYNKKLLDL